MPKLKPRTSLEVALESVISSETLYTQGEILAALARHGIKCPDQSTVSRTLKKLGVVKLRDPQTGSLMYRWPPKKISIAPPKSVKSLVREIVSNESIIVIHTDPGSAALVARYLDVKKPAEILGTLAGDDTIVVIPRSISETKITLSSLKASFQ